MTVVEKGGVAVVLVLFAWFVSTKMVPTFVEGMREQRVAFADTLALQQKMYLDGATEQRLAFMAGLESQRQAMVIAITDVRAELKATNEAAHNLAAEVHRLNEKGKR